jgi:hypothetical protein
VFFYEAEEDADHTVHPLQVPLLIAIVHEGNNFENRHRRKSKKIKKNRKRSYSSSSSSSSGSSSSRSSSGEKNNRRDKPKELVEKEK